MSRARAMSALGNRVLLCVGLGCLAETAYGAELAPYFQAWGGGSLTEARQSVPLDSAILAFGVTNGGCSLDPKLLRKLGEARAYVAAGGKLAISMGGADGVYAEVACNDAELVDILEMLMDRAGTRRFDWDVEGHQLAHAEGNARRSRVLARLQAKYPDLYTSFTLTGQVDGLSPDARKLLAATVAAGVRVDRVNVMTMSFGGKNLANLSPPTMGQAAILSLRAAMEQVASIFPNKTRAQLRSMMGITVMIGSNDDDTTFTLSDAQKVAEFARDSGLGLLSYWSFQRDKVQARPGWLPLAVYSGIVQEKHQFHRIFMQAQSAPCTYPDWVQHKAYQVDSVVTYGGRTYRAKHANPGYVPTVSTYYWAPYDCPVSQGITDQRKHAS